MLNLISAAGQRGLNLTSSLCPVILNPYAQPMGAALRAPPGIDSKRRAQGQRLGLGTRQLVVVEIGSTVQGAQT